MMNDQPDCKEQRHSVFLCGTHFRFGNMLISSPQLQFINHKGLSTGTDFSLSSEASEFARVYTMGQTKHVTIHAND